MGEKKWKQMEGKEIWVKYTEKIVSELSPVLGKPQKHKKE